MTGRDYDFVRIARARQAIGFTQDEMAERLGVAPMTVWRVEHGRNCSFELLLRIAGMLNLDWKKLITGKSILRASA